MAKWLIPVKETKMSEETKEIKKMKMEAMRHMVKAHIFKGERSNMKHLGELDLDKADNTRLVISLQDLADKLLTKKRKAESYIGHLCRVIEANTRALDEYGDEIIQLRQRLHESASMMEARDKQIAGLEEQLQKSNRQLAVFKEMFVDNSKNEVTSWPTIMGEEAATKTVAAGPNPHFMGQRSPIGTKTGRFR